MKKENWTIYVWEDKNYYKAGCFALIEGKEYCFGLRGNKKDDNLFIKERLIRSNQNTLKVVKNLGKRALTENGNLISDNKQFIENIKGSDFPVNNITSEQAEKIGFINK